ncbi:MAG: hypothetical protein A3K19_07670 [Lentisphaerae bacterium RIFOXYB12_FULL_65_16]|nr:MAG: hypothetical protein A3K18_07470 [Lentisphaerae bacterium RIFOXYA12_64_32]OGV87527.1 MAG: hypothetical protein A3K19_07670 [Lentisphaerae bacterium RIFOXYB12_FULL_65_16]
MQLAHFISNPNDRVARCIRWFGRHRLILLSILVGFLAGMLAVLLKIFIHFLQDWLKGGLDPSGPNWRLIVLPVVGVLISVLFVRFVLRRPLAKGLSSLIYAMSGEKTSIPRSHTYAHLLTSAPTVAFGGSVGLEAPIVLTGAAVGDNVAQSLRLSNQERTLLAACGSAAGIAAIFNSPVAGVVLAFEVLLTEVTAPAFVPLLIAAATGAVVSRVTYSGQLFFLITQGWVMRALPYYVVLGLGCGLLSAYIIRVSFFMERLFTRWKSTYIKALVGSLAVGILLFLMPPLYGEGYDTVAVLFAGQSSQLLDGTVFQDLGQTLWLPVLFSVAIILVKVVATAVTVGAGGNGGIFAPSLFTGALVGFAFTQTVGLLGLAELNQSNFVAVAMAGVLAGVIHAPLTAIFLIAEVTGGYVLFIPLMIVAALSYVVSRIFEPYSVYTKILASQGMWSQHNHDRTVLARMDLDALLETDFATVTPQTTLGELAEIIAQSTRNIFPVVNPNGKLLGVIYLDDIRPYMFRTDLYQVLVADDVMNRPPAVIERDLEMARVMRLFEKHRAWNLPVTDKGRYVGFVSQSRILSTYRRTLMLQESTRQPDEMSEMAAAEVLSEPEPPRDV